MEEPSASSRDRSDDTGITEPAPGSLAVSSTSMPVTSGAASRIAVSTASVSVTDDEGQPSQLPSIRSRTAPSSLSPTSSTSPPCEPR